MVFQTLLRLTWKSDEPVWAAPERGQCALDHPIPEDDKATSWLIQDPWAHLQSSNAKHTTPSSTKHEPKPPEIVTSIRTWATMELHEDDEDDCHSTSHSNHLPLGSRRHHSYRGPWRGNSQWGQRKQQCTSSCQLWLLKWVWLSDHVILLNPN